MLFLIRYTYNKKYIYHAADGEEHICCIRNFDSTYPYDDYYNKAYYCS